MLIAHADQQQRSLPDGARYAAIGVDEVVIRALAQLQDDILSTLAVARQLVVFQVEVALDAQLVFNLIKCR